MMVLCVACEFKLKPAEDTYGRVQIERYDRLESRYLTTGDFSALQQMNTDYPIETRTLIEKMLQIGEVSDRDIRTKFLMFYQDSTLQALVADAEAEYANMDDINQDLQESFDRLINWLPNVRIPVFYAQIGALDQSIVVGENAVGISLDKYLGENYPLYKKYYSYSQRKSMKRANIVPDCLVFYLLSLYPLDNFEQRPQLERDLHVAKVMWVANKAMDKNFFQTSYVSRIDRYMKKSGATIEQMLKDEDYSKLK